MLNGNVAVSEVEVSDVVTPALLKAFGGNRIITVVGPIVEKGAYYLDVEDHSRADGIFFHVLLAGRVASFLTKALKEKSSERFGSLSTVSVIHAALLHDITKVYAQDRERLPPAVKRIMGIREDFKETDPEVEAIGVEWLREWGFLDEVSANIVDHFPTEARSSLCWKIVLVADYMAGQKIMSVSERLDDVRERWITQLLQHDKEPKITPEAFNRAEVVIRDVADELFGIIGMTDSEFIDAHSLNLPEVSEQPWEKALMDKWKYSKNFFDRVQEITMGLFHIDPADKDAKKKLNEKMTSDTVSYVSARQVAFAQVSDEFSSGARR